MNSLLWSAIFACLCLLSIPLSAAGQSTTDKRFPYYAMWRHGPPYDKQESTLAAKISGLLVRDVVEQVPIVNCLHQLPGNLNSKSLSIITESRDIWTPRFPCTQAEHLEMSRANNIGWDGYDGRSSWVLTESLKEVLGRDKQAIIVEISVEGGGVKINHRSSDSFVASQTKELPVDAQVCPSAKLRSFLKPYADPLSKEHNHVKAVLSGAIEDAVYGNPSFAHLKHDKSPAIFEHGFGAWWFPKSSELHLVYYARQRHEVPAGRPGYASDHIGDCVYGSEFCRELVYDQRGTLKSDRSERDVFEYVVAQRNPYGHGPDDSVRFQIGNDLYWPSETVGVVCSPHESRSSTVLLDGKCEDLDSKPFPNSKGTADRQNQPQN